MPHRPERGGGGGKVAFFGPWPALKSGVGASFAQSTWLRTQPPTTGPVSSGAGDGGVGVAVGAGVEVAVVVEPVGPVEVEIAVEVEVELDAVLHPAPIARATTAATRDLPAARIARLYSTPRGCSAASACYREEETGIEIDIG